MSFVIRYRINVNLQLQLLEFGIKWLILSHFYSFVNMLLLFVLVASVSAYLDDVIDYKNYSIISTVASTSNQLSILRQIYLDDVSYKADFWIEPIKIDEKVFIGLPKSQVGNVEKILKSVGGRVNIEKIDLQKAVEDEIEANPPQMGRIPSSAFKLNQYHRYSEIETYLRQLALENPKLVRRSIIGHTAENHEIIVLKIGSGKSDRPIILIDAGIHAREWIAPATALYIINQLVTNYGKDKSITKLIDYYDWYFIPVLNPDGYAHTWSLNRNWRKNRSQPAPFTGCHGVDPNRNFELGFAGASTSKSPCSDLYPGPSPFSEPEARALKSVTQSNAKRIRIAITLHAFGQMWMNPWGYVNKRPSDYLAMVSASTKAVQALKSVHGTSYKTGSIFEVIYPTGGGSIDWQYAVLNTSYTYAIELRPQQRVANGFQLHYSQITPVGEETWKGISTLADHVMTKN